MLTTSPSLVGRIPVQKEIQINAQHPSRDLFSDLSQLALEAFLPQSTDRFFVGVPNLFLLSLMSKVFFSMMVMMMKIR